MKYTCSVQLVLVAALLTACGGGDSAGTSNEETGQGALQAIAGVWDSSTDEEGLTDVLYTVIRADGSHTEYDYFGDSFDNVADCYVRFDSTLTHEGDSRFTLSGDGIGDFNFEFVVQSGNLQVTFDGGESVLWPAASLTEADFLPICDSAVF